MRRAWGKRLTGTGNSWHDEFGSRLRGTRIAVTGATGFLGYHLAARLCDLGVVVYGLSRAVSAATLPDLCRPWRIDLTDSDGVAEAVRQLRPDLVYHLAGVVTGREDLSLVQATLQTNVVGSVNLFLALQATGCRRLIVVGSSEELTRLDGRDTPASPYAASKAACSLYARLFYHAFDLPAVLARPFATYGPRQAPDKLIPMAVSSLLRGASPEISSGERICDFVYVQDVVRGLILAGLQDGLEGQEVDLGTGQGIPIRDAVDSLVQLCKSDVHPRYLSTSDRRGHTTHVADAEKTREQIGWQPVWTLDSGLEETVDWYRSEEPGGHGGD